ncbi:ATP-binding protein [bacterium]|nr:ATP-binding protein [bacterium]
MAEDFGKTQEHGVRKAGPALEMLIRQFSQPLACLRELVQNAIDAGTNQVEVTLSETEGEGVCLSVRDTGEGMNRQVIETQLTRLFASAKDGDLTKVGKFGIGFVSVFSLNPLAVVVDTGRDGEFWRILFHPDKSYELLKLSDRVEGTVVHIYLARLSTDFNQKLKRVDETLRYWCKHCRVEVVFNGHPISMPFSLNQSHEVYHELPGTRMVVALTRERENFAGFYNQGLTLLEGCCSPLPYLSFKVDSRYFEHTLTRDNVIENEDYDKALKLVRETVASKLAPELYERLRQGQADWELLDSLRALDINIEEAGLFPDLSGKFWNLQQLRRARVYHQSQPDELSTALHDPALGLVVLATGKGQQWLQTNLLDCQPTQACWGFCKVGQQPALEKTLAICQPELKAWKLPPIQLVRWLPGTEKPFLQPARRIGLVEWAERSDPTLVLLDQEHPFCQKLVQMQAWSQALAVQFLLQHYLLIWPEEQRLKSGPRLSEAVLRRM